MQLLNSIISHRQVVNEYGMKKLLKLVNLAMTSKDAEYFRGAQNKFTYEFLETRSAMSLSLVCVVLRLYIENCFIAVS